MTSANPHSSTSRAYREGGAATAVPMLDPTWDLHEHEAALQAAFTTVLRSGRYIMGPEVEGFERCLAAFLGVPFAVGTSSGTDALLLTLMALKIGPGDQVIVPTYTFFATAGSVARVGAEARFVDVCPGCFNALPQAIEAATGAQTRAIMPVHLFGQPAAMDAILAHAQRADAAVVEDAAQALGSQSAGVRGHAACYSFFPSKNLGGFGDAGLVATADAAVHERLLRLRVHGARSRYLHDDVGGNFRLDALQAALLRTKLPHLSHHLARRRHHAQRYMEIFLRSGLAQPSTCICDGAPTPTFDAPIVLPCVARPTHTFNQFVVRLPRRRDLVRDCLRAQHIGCEIYYPTPLHRQPCFARLGWGTTPMPHADAAAAQTLALPIYPGLSDDAIEKVAAAVIVAAESPG